MRLKGKKLFVALALSISAFPVWAAHNYSADWNPLEPITIGTTQIKPGQYELKAEEGKSELRVLQGSKVIVTIPVHWKTLPTKTKDTQILTDGGKVTEVQFGGSAQEADIDQ